MYIAYDGEDISMVAPESYHGDFKLSYGHSLTIVFILKEYSPNHNSYIRYVIIIGTEMVQLLLLYRIANGALQLYSRFPIPLSMDLVGAETIKYTFMVRLQ